MNNLTNHKIQRRAKRLVTLLTCVVLLMAVMAVPAAAAATTPAATDPLKVVTNLSNFIFSFIRAVGMILLGYSVLQVGLSLQSHDPSQQSNGMLTIAGGIVITFTKEILTLITGSGV